MRPPSIVRYTKAPSGELYATNAMLGSEAKVALGRSCGAGETSRQFWPASSVRTTNDLLLPTTTAHPDVGLTILSQVNSAGTTASPVGPRLGFGAAVTCCLTAWRLTLRDRNQTVAPARVAANTITTLAKASCRSGWRGGWLGVARTECMIWVSQCGGAGAAARSASRCARRRRSRSVSSVMRPPQAVPRESCGHAVSSTPGGPRRARCFPGFPRFGRFRRSRDLLRIASTALGAPLS